MAALIVKLRPWIQLKRIKIPPSRHYDIVLPLIDAAEVEPYDVMTLRMLEGKRAAVESFPEHCVLVIPESPESVRRALSACAWYFKRQFQYDAVPYNPDGEGWNTRDRGWLWTQNEIELVGIGGCVFRWREYKDKPHGYGLQWVWFHPYERRRKHLSRMWDKFRALYGKFAVEDPLSDEMIQFLKKRGEWD